MSQRISNGDGFKSARDLAAHLDEIRKTIGVIPESHGCYDWMTATEYLHYF